MITATLASLSPLAAATDQVVRQERLQFEALPGGWLAVGELAVLAALGWAIWWMYRHEGRRGAPLRVRTALAVIRCLAIAVLAVIWIEPVLATYVTYLVESHTLVLVDDSASMGLADAYADPAERKKLAAVFDPPPEGPVRRSEIVQALLAGPDHRLAARLTANNAVKLYRFSEGLTEIATLPAQRNGANNGATSNAANAANAAAFDLGLTAQGKATNAATALEQALQAVGDTPIAAVVMLTDGGFSEPDAYAALATTLSAHGLGLHVIGVGDPAPPQNVAVVELTAPTRGFRGRSLRDHRLPVGHRLGRSAANRRADRPTG